MYIYQLDRALLREQIRSVAHYIHGRVLDIGSGTHDRYQEFFSVQEYMRMDVHAGTGVDIVGSADNIPLPDNSFDCAVSTQVFEHLASPEKAAQEIGRVLKRGGYALITAPQWSELHEEPHDYWRYTHYGLAALFERNGFTTVAMEQRGGFFAEGAQRRARYFINRFDLYNRPILGRLASRLFVVCGALALWLDARDTSAQNRRHAIGWCAVFKKK